jgi:FkbM family methyltransferase
MKARITTYLVARLKLAFGRAMAALADVAFLRQVPAALQLVRIGTDYGGWYCCRELLSPDRTAMCCGAGEDISFDVALNAQWEMRIICVDPTPRSIRHVAAFLAASRDGRRMLIEAGPLSYEMTGFREDKFTFVPCAVWSSDGILDLFAPKDPAHVSYSAVNLQHTSEMIQVPSSTVASLLRDSGVARLSLLKLDIEGAEYEVLRSMLSARIHPEQLLVEFDQVNQPLTPLFWVELVRVLQALRDAGYRLVNRERANYVFVHLPALER